MQHAINLGYHDALMYIPPDIQVLMVSISLLLNNESSHADRSYDAYYLIWVIWNMWYISRETIIASCPQDMTYICNL